MPTLSSKHKLRAPAGSDSLQLAVDLTNLRDDVDKKLPHAGIPYFGTNYVYSGGTHSAPGGLLAAFTAGVAMINGQTFDFPASGNLVIPASSTIRFWLTATFDANGFITGSTYAIRTDSVIPASSVLLAEWTTNTTVPTNTNMTFRGIISPGKVIAEATPLTSTVTGVGEKMTFPLVGDGVTTYELAFTGWYITTSAVALAILNMRDTGGAVTYNEVQHGVPVASTVANPNHSGPTIPPFLGFKTIALYLTATGGTPSLAAAAGSPARFLAKAKI